MKTVKTKYQRIHRDFLKLEEQLAAMKRDKESKEKELEKYVRQHRSLKYDRLVTSDVGKQKKIYAYFDALYPIQWQGGLRCDNRGMALFYWLDSDPDYLILHLSSTSDHICFGGSTSWIVKAETLADKVEVLTKVKKDLQKIINGKSMKGKDGES